MQLDVITKAGLQDSITGVTRYRNNYRISYWIREDRNGLIGHSSVMLNSYRSGTHLVLTNYNVFESFHISDVLAYCLFVVVDGIYFL
jgi:hypothetical protein